MNTISITEKPFTFRFIEAKPKFLLELTNVTAKTLKSIEILTVFLKDEETPGGGPSQAHIRFDAIKSMQPKERAVLFHRTWINGRPADAERDQLERFKIKAANSALMYWISPGRMQKARPAFNEYRSATDYVFLCDDPYL